MAKNKTTGFDPVAWQTSAPATKEEKREKRKAEKERKRGGNKPSNKKPTKENSNEKLNTSKLKYGIFVGACLLAVGGTGFWAVSSQNSSKANASQLVELAKNEVKEAKKKAEAEKEKQNALTKKEYTNNVKLLVKGIKTLSKKENGDVTGYFVSNGKYYNVVTYDRETGQLYVIETTEKATSEDMLSQGNPLVLGKDWVSTLLVRLEADNS
jgi:hypothetical protein